MLIVIDRFSTRSLIGRHLGGLLGTLGIGVLCCGDKVYIAAMPLSRILDVRQYVTISTVLPRVRISIESAVAVIAVTAVHSRGWSCMC